MKKQYNVRKKLKEYLIGKQLVYSNVERVYRERF